MPITGLDTVDWHSMGFLGIAVVCVVILIAMLIPADVGVRHKDDDDDPNYPTLPPF